MREVRHQRSNKQRLKIQILPHQHGGHYVTVRKLGLGNTYACYSKYTIFYNMNDLQLETAVLALRMSQVRTNTHRSLLSAI